MAGHAHSVLVVGAGPAGLATSGELTRRAIDHVVLEQGDRVGYTWENLYDSLTLHTGKHMSSLPGMPFPASTPLFPPRRTFLDYLHRYAETFRLPVKTGRPVTAVERAGGRWVVRAPGDTFEAPLLVIATGIISNPYAPEFAGRARFRGRVIHSVAYRRPDPFRGRRVLVVGVGNSGGEISAELAAAGARVTISVRSGAIAVPRELFGIPIQYFACVTAKLPRPVQRAIIAMVGKISELVVGPPALPRPRATPCPDVPLIGFHLPDAIRKGVIRVRGGIAEFTEDGIRFADGVTDPFDDVILATGYRAALGMLRELIRVDECGFALRKGRVASLDHPGLYFVGHNYDGRGGLYNIALDAALVARLVAAQLS